MPNRQEAFVMKWSQQVQPSVARTWRARNEHRDSISPKSEVLKTWSFHIHMAWRTDVFMRWKKTVWGGGVIQDVLMIVSKENQKMGRWGSLSATNYYTNKQFEQWGLWVSGHHHTQCPKHLQWQNRYCRKSWPDVTRSGRRLQFLVHGGGGSEAFSFLPQLLLSLLGWSCLRHRTCECLPPQGCLDSWI